MGKILVTGADGMLGSELVAVLSPVHEVTAADVGDFDITDPDAVAAAVRSAAPGLVVNCAAYTDVDGAEANRELAFAVNGRGAGNLAEAAARAGARVLHLSTDYVFDGTKSSAYTEDDEPNPLSVYGESKLEGERRVLDAAPEALIVRTAWLYGHRGRNFVETILKAASERRGLRVVDDQRGTPTNAADLALIIKELIAIEAEGVVNATNTGSCSWCEFAREILRLAGLTNVTVDAVSSSEFPRPAKRPGLSVLALDRLSGLLGWVPRAWEESLAEYIAER